MVPVNKMPISQFQEKQKQKNYKIYHLSIQKKKKFRNGEMDLKNKWMVRSESIQI